jgi:hypothetical protein
MAIVVPVQNIANNFWRQTAVGILVDHHAGRQAAGADAGYCFQSITQIICSSPCFNPQVLLGSFEYFRAAPDVAGSAQTNPGNITAPRLQVELGIKRNNSKNLAEGHFQLLSYLLEDFFGEIPIDVLGFLQDRNDSSFVVAVLV